MNASILISLASTAIAVSSVVITIVQMKRNWYVTAITRPRLEWSDNIRRLLADLIDDYYAGKEHLPAKIDCLMLHLNRKNKWQKDLVKKLDEMKVAGDGDLDELILAAQAVLRYNWWAVKTESFVTYRMDVRRDKKLEKRAKQHKKAEGTQTKETPVDMVLKVFVTQEQPEKVKESDCGGKRV